MALFILPFVLIVSISFSNENDITRFGYSLIVKNISTTAYAYIFKNPQSIINSYLVTTFFAFAGTAVSIFVMALSGYALSRDAFTYKKFVTYPLLLTMFFSGGLIPLYIINTQVFHLTNNLMVYIMWGMISGYTIFVFRSFFSQIPKSLIESADLDGANEFQILWHVILPLSTPVLATFGFIGIVTRWNNFEASLYYISIPKLYSLQYLLQLVLKEVAFLRMSMSGVPEGVTGVIPMETIKFAMCVVAAGPMVLVFPFFQKYFSKGMVVGAVKG